MSDDPMPSATRMMKSFFTCREECPPCMTSQREQSNQKGIFTWPLILKKFKRFDTQIKSDFILFQ